MYTGVHAHIVHYQGRIESRRDERACNVPCSILKRQNSYEFIHDLKNSNSIQEFTGVYLLKWRHGLLERLLMKKLLNDQGSGCRKEIYNIAVKNRVVAPRGRDLF